MKYRNLQIQEAEQIKTSKQTKTPKNKEIHTNNGTSELNLET